MSAKKNAGCERVTVCDFEEDAPGTLLEIGNASSFLKYELRALTCLTSGGMS